MSQSRASNASLPAAILDGSAEAIISQDLDGVVTSWNRAAEDLFGHSADDILGKPMSELFPEDLRLEKARIAENIRQHRRSLTVERVRETKGGRKVPVSITVSPIRDNEGELTGFSEIVREASSSRENERRIALLLREVHHRVKNNLQSVAALIQMQPMPDDVKRELRSQVSAIAALHEHLHQPATKERINLAHYITELLAGVNALYGDRVRIDLQLESLSVNPDIATPVGLIANELITNTNKYAFPDGSAGNFGASLTRMAPGLAELRMFNDGVPFEASPNSAGIGIQLIHGLAIGLDPDFHLEGSNGLNFRVSLPIID